MRNLVAVVVALFLVATTAFAVPAQVTLTISGMHCESCATGISSMLKRTEGVVKADVSYEDRQAIVDYDSAKTSPEKIIEAVEKMGYKAAIRK